MAEIWWNLNRTTPNKPVYGLACSMASLDTQTVLDLIEKYKGDLKMTQKQITEEIQKQKRRKLFNEFKTVLDTDLDMRNVNN